MFKTFAVSLLLSSFFFCPILLAADQSPFGPIIGKTLQVATERRQFGDVLTFISISTRVSDEARVTDMNLEALGEGNISTLNIYSPPPALFNLQREVTARCEGAGVSQDPFCIAIRDVNSCDFNNLSARARMALNFLLGPCLKSCLTVAQTLPWGETSTQYQWSCQNQAQAQCVMVSGMEERIDLIYHGSTCSP